MIVNTLAKITDVSPHTIRHYTKIGILKPTKHDENGYNIYGQKDINLVLFTQRAKQLGFTLKEIKTMIELSAQGHSPCPEARTILKKHIIENRRHLNQLIRLQQRMENALSLWQGMPNGVPNGDHICELIESTKWERE